jgi:DNA polymerase elongation subunit (family B)
MELFKKWDTSIKIRESYSLDFVAEKILGGEGKVHYTGGLQQLYEQDYKMYLFYNLIDTILVQMIHEKMKYINILYAISALSKVRTLDAFSALRVTEGLMRNDFRNKKNIILCKDYESSSGGPDDGVLGGYVKDPNRGLNKWVVCYDFASLYPTTQRQNNIAPENFKGMKIDSKHYDYKGRRFELDPNDIVCINNAVFNRDFSVTCNKLTEIYNDRKSFKKKMLKAKDELKSLQNELAELMMHKS